MSAEAAGVARETVIAVAAVNSADLRTLLMQAIVP